MKRVFLELTGGLGNQLFQYAAGLACSAELKSELVVDIRWYKKRRGINVSRAVNLWDFSISARRASSIESIGLRFYTNRMLRRVPWLRTLDVVGEGIRTAPTEARRRGMFLRGFFQDHSVVEQCAQRLRSELRLRKEIASGLSRFVDDAAIRESVALHVRRGDYATLPTAETGFAPCPLDYYDRALSLIRQSGKVDVVNVFSDDPDWCARQKVFAGCNIVREEWASSPSHALIAMSKCRHNIISNSTFSWWAAWLNDNSKKIVVAPSVWSQRKAHPGLLPSTWHQI